MTMDLSEFHDVFFEECFEGLDVMESGLLNLDNGTDFEEINTIFRAAHSIKGGGASFGFMEISDFTHIMETLLDEMRDERRAVTRDGVDLLLKSVDVLRGMVIAARDETDNDLSTVNAIKLNLESMLAGTSAEAATATCIEKNNDLEVVSQAIASEPADKSSADWKIYFRPHTEMLKNGNDPGPIFCELQRRGEIQLKIDTSKVPCIDEINPKLCYLDWELELTGEINREEIDELFNGVVDESELEISQQGESVQNVPVQSEAVQDGDIVKSAEVVDDSEALVSPDEETCAIEGNTKTSETVQASQKTSKAGKDSGSIRVQ